MKHFYFLLFTFFALNLSFGQVIITELADPNDDANARFVEIYNISNTAVDFTDWELRRWSNDNANYTASSSLVLSPLGTLNPGEFAILARPGFEDAFGVTPNITSTKGSLDSNGDDKIAVVDSSGEIIDIFGTPGSDCNNASTAENFEDGRAERALNVTSSNQTWTASEWNTDNDQGFGSGAQNVADGFDPGSWIGASSVPTISISSPSNNNVFNPGTSSVPVLWATNNAPTGASVNIVVDGTETSGVSSPYTINTTDGTTYSVTVNLVDGGSTVATDNVSFSVGSYTQVNDIAALRAGTEGNFYELSGEAFISYIVTDNTRNQKYIQDQSGGILIDDVPGTLSTAFDVGDGVTGLKGKLNSFGGILQLNPVENIASASSTNNSITPEVVTLAGFLANSSDYQSELIKIENVTFSATGVFADNTDYVITSGAEESILRVVFGDENLIGANIPTTSGFIIGLGAEYSGTPQIYPRYASDVERVSLSLNNFSAIAFNLYPNPTNTGFVTIKSNQMGAVQAQVFDLLGKEVINTAVNNERLDVSNLNAGVYVVKLTQNKNTTTKKLIVQ